MIREMLTTISEWQAKQRVIRQADINADASAIIMYRKLRIAGRNRLVIGPGSTLSANVSFERDAAEVIIGANTEIGASHIVCATRVEIGDDVLIAWGCTINDHNSHPIPWSQRKDDIRERYFGRKDWSNVVSRPIKLGNKCWIGMHSIILKGVEVGEGAIVGAGSVVTSNVPPWTIVGGNPARVIREISATQR